VVATYHPESLQTPSHIAENPKRLAVVLDCEMAGTSGGSDEAIYICAADYLTGEILINGFVNPNTRIIQMRASIHGISKATLEDAVAEGKALSGWEGARSELWKYIDDHTILVGHSLEHDLNVLRLIHPRIVDAGILAKNAVGLHHRWGLQRLCSEFLILEIRRNKGRVHDCLEDVLATREVVLMSTREKEAFQYWAEAKRKEKKQVKKNGQARIRRKRKDKQTKEAVQNTTNATSQHTTDEETGDNNDCEYMRWEDVAEDMGYPHPDTGYDPWSD
jgi:DNA polymerase III epsilon subunit-like protein